MKLVSVSQWILAAAVCVLGAGIACAAQSIENYPTRPVRMIVPFGPGGASDFVGRILQPKLSEILGAQLVVDNRTGADGNIGVEVAARANADGYTMLLGNVGTMAINPSVYPTFPVSPMRDLIGLTLVTDLPGAIAIHPSIPASTLKEFLDYAKAHPGKLNHGSAGASSATRLAFEYLLNKTGISIMHIPYKTGAGGATLALLGGEVVVSSLTVASFIPYVKSGKLKVLAVQAPNRVPQLPDTPTMIELGFPELRLGSWQGMYVPARTPESIVNKLHSAVMKVMADPWVIERLANGGAVVVTSKSRAEFGAFMKAQTEFWEKLVKQAGAVVSG